MMNVTIRGFWGVMTVFSFHIVLPFHRFGFLQNVQGDVSIFVVTIKRLVCDNKTTKHSVFPSVWNCRFFIFIDFFACAC